MGAGKIYVAVTSCMGNLSGEIEIDHGGEGKNNMKQPSLFKNKGLAPRKENDLEGFGNASFSKWKTYVTSYLGCPKEDECEFSQSSYGEISLQEKYNVIKQDIHKFRELKEMIKSKGIVTNVAAQQLLPDLVDNIFPNNSSSNEGSRAKQLMKLNSFRLTKDNSHSNGMNWQSKSTLSKTSDGKYFENIALKDDI